MAPLPGPPMRRPGHEMQYHLGALLGGESLGAVGVITGEHLDVRAPLSDLIVYNSYSI